MERMTRPELKNILVQICTFAQNHSHDEDAWGPRNTPEMHNWMQHTSHVVSCFLSQNTELGNEGVESEIVEDELCGPVLTKEQWEKVINKKITELSKPMVY